MTYIKRQKNKINLKKNICARPAFPHANNRTYFEDKAKNSWRKK